MSIALSLKDDRWWQALIAASFREGPVVWALVIDLIAVLSEGYAILAFLVCLMLTLALSFDLFQICLKTLVLHEFISIREAVYTLLARSMIAWLLYLFNVLFSDSEAVNTLRVGSVVAVRLFDLLIGFWLIRLLF